MTSNTLKYSVAVSFHWKSPIGPNRAENPNIPSDVKQCMKR